MSDGAFATGLAGTPACMAPEQYQPGARIDARTDVWALGIILYELLTGERLFRGKSLAELRAAIADKTPVDLDHLQHRAPSGLARICKKCLQKSPAGRYQSAAALAEALWRQCPRRMQPASVRRKTTARFIAATLVIGALVMGSSLLLAIRARSHMSSAEQQALSHRAKLDKARYTDDMFSAYQAWNLDRLESLHTILESHRPLPGEADQRGYEWHLLNSISKQPEPTLLVGHEGAVNEMALFPDRRHMASVGEDGTLRIWDVATRKCIAAIDFGKALENIDLTTGGLHSVAVSPDSRYVAAGADVVGICDVEQDYQVRELYRADYNVDSLEFAADGERIAAGTRYEDVSLLSLDGEVLARIPCHSRAEALAYLPERKLWIVPNGTEQHNEDYSPMFLQLWTDHFERVKRTLDTTRQLGYSSIKFARVAPSLRYAVAASSTGPELFVLELISGTVVATKGGFRDRCSDLDISPDATVMAIGLCDGNLCYQPFVDMDDKGKVSIDVAAQTIFAHEGGCHGIRFLDSETLLTCGADGLKTWDTRQFANKVEIRLEANSLLRPEFSTDGRRLVVGTIDAGVWFIDGFTGEVLGSHPHPDVIATARSPSGKKIAMVGRTDRTTTIRNVDTRAQVSMGPHLSITYQDPIKEVDFAPDGQTVATIGRFLRLTNTETGEILHDRLLPNMARVVSFSHRGDWLAYGGEFGHVCIWNLVNDQPTREMKCNSPTVSIAFSRDDRLLASGHHDAIIRLWDVSTGQFKAELIGHEQWVASLSFSPDGRSLLSTDNETLRVWSVGEQRLLGTLHRQTGLVAVTISPDGRRVAASIRESNPNKPNLILWTVDDSVQ